MRILFTLVFFLIAMPLEAKEVKVKAINLEPVASEKVVLTIKTQENSIATYSHPQIEAIGLKQMVTTTFWPEDYGEFDGVLLRDLLGHAGIEKSSQIKVTALDGYTALIPREDWQKWDVLVATRHEKKMIPIRRKGPLRMIYPKDIGGKMAASDMRIRWIWAIKTIEPVF